MHNGRMLSVSFRSGLLRTKRASLVIQNALTLFFYDAQPAFKYRTYYITAQFPAVLAVCFPGQTVGSVFFPQCFASPALSCLLGRPPLCVITCCRAGNCSSIYLTGRPLFKKTGFNLLRFSFVLPADVLLHGVYRFGHTGCISPEALRVRLHF